MFLVTTCLKLYLFNTYLLRVFCLWDIEQDAERKIGGKDIAPVLNRINGLDTWGWRGQERIHRWCQVPDYTIPRRVVPLKEYETGRPAGLQRHLEMVDMNGEHNEWRDLSMWFIYHLFTLIKPIGIQILNKRVRIELMESIWKSHEGIWPLKAQEPFRCPKGNSMK